jgi:hypothetical protein
MNGLDYYISERFIHDELARCAEVGLDGVYRGWKKDKKVLPFIITWPSDSVLATSGKTIEGPCVMQLPEDQREIWQELMIKAIQVTNAYAILRTEQREDDIQVIFESKHGSRCWTIPIVRSGDANVLRQPRVTDDKEHIGLLWKRDREQPS